MAKQVGLTLGLTEASRWFKNGDHPDDYSKPHEGLENGEPRIFTPEQRKASGWEGDVVRYFRRPDMAGRLPCASCGVPMHEHGWIDSGGDGHTVCPGNWVIKTQDERGYLVCDQSMFLRAFKVQSINSNGRCWVKPRTEKIAKALSLIPVEKANG